MFDIRCSSSIRFVSQKSDQKLKPLGNSNEDNIESNEPDYDEDKDQLEVEKQEEQQQTGVTTRNQVF
jgi:hypothetical protein